MPDLDQFNEILHGPQYTSFCSGIADILLSVADMPLELRGHEGDIARALDASIATLIVEKYEPQRCEGINALTARYPDYGNRDTYWPEMSTEETIKLDIIEILDLFSGLLQRQIAVSMASRAKVIAMLSIILCKMNDRKQSAENPIYSLREALRKEINKFPKAHLSLGEPDNMAYLPITLFIYVAGHMPQYETDSHDFSNLGCY